MFTILDMEPEMYDDIFKIFNYWLDMNLNSSINKEYVLNLIFINLDIPNKYFIWLLKNKNVYNTKIINVMKNKLLKMNIEQLENNKNPNLLLDLLINSNDDLCLDLLKKSGI